MMEDKKDSYEWTWNEALRSTRDILGEDDFEFVQNYESAEHLLHEIQILQNQSARTTVVRLLRSVRPHVTHLETFATFMVVAAGSGSISLACVWGVVYLLIQLGSRSDDTLREIARYLCELSEKIELFEVYKKSIDLDPELLEKFFGFLVDLVLVSATAIKHFRKNDIRRVIQLPSWNNVDRQFTKTLQDFTSRIEHLRQLVEAHQLTEMRLKQDEVIRTLSKYNINSDLHGLATLPYFQLPFGRNPAFHGRTNVLNEIRDALTSSASDRSIQSVALWGIGGIGKSQIALEYANLRIQENCQLVLWLPAQTQTDMSRAVVNAASQVRPPGYEEGMSPEKTRFIMWNWLQTTETSWVIIFDNVDDNDLLTSNWPITGNGQIVVTCRSELIAACPAKRSVEISSFAPKEGGELLLKLAGKKNVSNVDIAAAEELSGMLGGLPLAIDITARQILVKKKNMEQFLPYFKKNKQSLRMPPRYAAKNPYYNENLVTVWKTAFDSLDENSSRLLGLICFFAPDDIPRTVINTTSPIPGTWQFLTHTDEYEEAEAQLLYASLIKINDDTGMISLHRLVQEAYYFYMSESRHHETFGVAYRLLCDAFPKRTLRRQMYLVWGECELLIHHIEAAQDKYEELRLTGLNIQDPALDIMLADAAWFCGEACLLQLGEKLGRRAANNCADKTSLIYAYLCESVATIDHRRGRYGAAHVFFLRSLEIREKEPTTTGPELADAYSAVGLALFGLFKSKEAIGFVDKALAISYAVPQEAQHTFNIDRYLRNRSRPQAALGNFEDAKKDVAAAEAFQTKVYGPDSHFHGETAYILGKIATQEGDLDLAMRHLQRAYDLQYPGKPTHQSVASALYHKALVYMSRPDNQEENDKQALEYLRQALTVTEFNEPRRGDQGESARIKWQISKIWERQGRSADAATYRTAALRVKTALERTGLYPDAPDEDQSWDCFSDLVDR